MESLSFKLGTSLTGRLAKHGSDALATAANDDRSLLTSPMHHERQYLYPLPARPILHCFEWPVSALRRGGRPSHHCPCLQWSADVSAWVLPLAKGYPETERAFPWFACHFLLGELVPHCSQVGEPRELFEYLLRHPIESTLNR